MDEAWRGCARHRRTRSTPMAAPTRPSSSGGDRGLLRAAARAGAGRRAAVRTTGAALSAGPAALVTTSPATSRARPAQRALAAAPSFTAAADREPVPAGAVPAGTTGASTMPPSSCTAGTAGGGVGGDDALRPVERIGAGRHRRYLVDPAGWMHSLAPKPKRSARRVSSRRRGASSMDTVTPLMAGASRSAGVAIAIEKRSGASSAPSLHCRPVSAMKSMWPSASRRTPGVRRGAGTRRSARAFDEGSRAMPGSAWCAWRSAPTDSAFGVTAASRCRPQALPVLRPGRTVRSVDAHHQRHVQRQKLRPLLPDGLACRRLFRRRHRVFEVEDDCVRATAQRLVEALGTVAGDE